MKRLSLIVDKQEKIKDYLSNFSEILEEADESNQTTLNTTHNLPSHGNNTTLNNNSQNQTLVDIVDNSSSQLNDRNVSDSSNELNDNSKPTQSNFGINKLKITRRNEEINEEETLNSTQNMNKTNKTQNATRKSFAPNRMSYVGVESRFELDAQFNDESADILDELNHQNGNQNEFLEMTSNVGSNFVDSRRSFNTPSNQSFNVRFLDKKHLDKRNLLKF